MDPELRTENAELEDHDPVLASLVMLGAQVSIHPEAGAGFYGETELLPLEDVWS